MDHHQNSFYSVASDAEVTSVYTQELSDLDVETKELGLFDPLNLPAMLKNEKQIGSRATDASLAAERKG